MWPKENGPGERNPETRKEAMKLHWRRLITTLDRVVKRKKNSAEKMQNQVGICIGENTEVRKRPQKEKKQEKIQSGY